jgi:lipopolysaccharide transport system ATP-binding protein
MSVILKASNISKQYRLGLIGTGTLSHDLNRWWHKLRGKEDPYLKIGESNDRSIKAESEYVWALRDIDFEVHQGEVLGIIGKNGAGKSTLLKILSRVTTPTIGEIKTRGRIASLLEVGTGFHPELTGRENIFLNGAILGMAKSEISKKLNEIIEFSGCQRYVDTPVKRYSSGMRVRLAFAVAAFLEPDILVIDEVLAVGDAEFQKKAIGKMQDISTGDGRTVLFVSHNMAAVKSLCTRAIVLEQGKLVFSGTQHEAVDYYLKSSSENLKIPLLNRKDRIGNGQLLLKNITFLNYRNESVSEIISGNELNIKVEVEKIVPIDYSRLIISVAFQDTSMNTVLMFSSDEIGFNFANLEDMSSFTLHIPQLLLRGSVYSIRIVIAYGTTMLKDMVDIMDYVAQVHVIAGDFWKSGRTNRRLEQALLPADFKIQ